jgi:ABC-type nitrate/sulfonate/bicarbonate transport system substrate-binding protein
MNIRKRGAIAAGLLLATSTALTACGSDTPETTDKADGLGKVSVQFSWIKNAEFAGEFLADSNGYFKKAGFSGVEFLPGPVAQEAIVATGKADFGMSNAVSVASAIANSKFPLKIVGATYQKNPFTILSLKDKGNLASPKDMCGKKIGVADPNLSLFKALVAANKLTCKITIVPNGFDVAPLEDGEIDGLVAYATNESLLVKGHGFDTVDMMFADNGLPFVAETITTTDDMIAKHPDAVKAFLKADILGWKDACDGEAGYKAGAELAVTKYGKEIDPPLELKKEVAQSKQQCELLVNSDETAKNGLFTISPEMVAANIASIKAAGIDISADDLFDTSLLDDLYAEEPGLK